MMRQDSLENAIQQYKSAQNGDFWQVISNPLRKVRDKMILDLLVDIKINRALDFASGLGVIANEVAQKATFVLGVDGALPAVEKAKQIHKATNNVEFKQATLEQLPRLLEKGNFEILITTDTFSYFSREEQKYILDQARRHEIEYLLLEIRTVDRSGAVDFVYHSNSDFEQAKEIFKFIESSGYRIIRRNISRFHTNHDILKRGAYILPNRMLAVFIRRYLIDAVTLIAYLPYRFKGDKIYDLLILEKRLKLATLLYRIPGSAWVIEPMIAGVALLCRKK